MKNDFEDRFKALYRLGKRYVGLQIDLARLTLAEKLTLLVGGLAIGFICFIALGFILLLLAFAVADFLQNVMSAGWSFMCVAGIILLILLILVIFNKQLILNPIARLVSKVLCDKKEEENKK